MDMRASAVLIWLDEGVNPAQEGFGPSKVCSPPSPNPEAWWLLEEAIRYVGGISRDHRKMPWIKTGDTLLGPAQIDLAYSALLGTLHEPARTTDREIPQRQQRAANGQRSANVLEREPRRS